MEIYHSGKDCTATYFTNSRIKFLHVKLQRICLFWYLKNLKLLKHSENPEKSLWDEVENKYWVRMIRNEISTCICESTNNADDGHFRKSQTKSACSKIAEHYNKNRICHLEYFQPLSQKQTSNNKTPKMFPKNTRKKNLTNKLVINRSETSQNVSFLMWYWQEIQNEHK